MAESDIPREILSEYTDTSLSDIHHTLRASRRRLAIALVAHRAIRQAVRVAEENEVTAPRSQEVVVPVRELAREIVAIEEETSLAESTGETYRNVYTALIQSHLKQLDDVGAVDYDPDRKTVTPDRNLLALSVVTATTSAVAQAMFHNAVVEVYGEKPVH